MRVTNFQLYEIIGASMHLEDFVGPALTLFKADHPQVEIVPEKDHKYRENTSYDMLAALRVLNTFSGDSQTLLPEFTKYMILVIKKQCENAQVGSIRYESREVATRFLDVIDKIISGEWLWK
jgi:hypothetical protein